MFGVLRVKDGRFPLYGDGSKYHSPQACMYFLGIWVFATVYMYVCERGLVCVSMCL